MLPPRTRPRARSSPLTVLVGRSVNGLLGGGGSVNGGHQTLDNSKVVVDNLGQRRQTVGSARSVGDDVVLGLVSVQVYSTDKHGSVGRGGRDDDLLGTSLQVGGSLVDGGEDTGGLDDVVGTVGSPRDGSRVTLLVNGDLLAVDDELSVLVRDLALESTVGRVVLSHVDHVLHVNKAAEVHQSNRENKGELHLPKKRVNLEKKSNIRLTKKNATDHISLPPLSTHSSHTLYSRR